MLRHRRTATADKCQPSRRRRVLYDGSPAHSPLDALWEVAVETHASVFGMGSAYAARAARYA